MNWVRATSFGLALVAIALVASDAAAEEQGKCKKLWDGKTLTGWHKIGVGEWTIEDGAIVGRKKKEDPNFGHLVTDAQFKDFVVRVKFKAIQGNSGFYFRIEEKGGSGVSGFQAEIDPAGNSGGLYETNGRAWVAQPKPELVQKAFKPNEWNEMVVSAQGGDIEVTLNGVKTADLKNDPGKWTKGHIALQLHGGNDMLVMFKDIEITEKK
jgi:hypothetical protein